jgi:hypothetical protein
MTIADIAKKANVEGQISPQLLAGAVNKSFKNRAFSGAGDLGELSDIAQTFMKEPPNSGSAARGAEMLKNMFVPGVAGGIDAGLAFHDPMLAAQLAGGGAALAGTKFAGQAIRGALARSPTMRNMLINGPASNPVGNAVINIGNLAQPAVIPAGVVGANSFLTGHYSLQALLPQPANLYAPNPPAP